MNLIKSMIGGLAGAVALNLLHETIKHLDHEAPRVDLIGEEALQKGMIALGAKPFSGNRLYAATLVGDLISNTCYYSLIGTGKRKYLVIHGFLHGAAAGIGALKLTKPMGLSDAPVTRTIKTKVLTVAYYTLGGIIAAITMQALGSKK
jgi:hypothetical protein